MSDEYLHPRIDRILALWSIGQVVMSQCQTCFSLDPEVQLHASRIEPRFTHSKLDLGAIALTEADVRSIPDADHHPPAVT